MTAAAHHLSSGANGFGLQLATPRQHWPHRLIGSENKRNDSERNVQRQQQKRTDTTKEQRLRKRDHDNNNNNKSSNGTRISATTAAEHKRDTRSTAAHHHLSPPIKKHTHSHLHLQLHNQTKDTNISLTKQPTSKTTTTTAATATRSPATHISTHSIPFHSNNGTPHREPNDNTKAPVQGHLIRDAIEIQDLQLERNHGQQQPL